MGTSSSSQGPAPATYPSHPCSLSVDKVSEILATDPEVGLQNKILPNLQSKYGENKLDGESSAKWHEVFLRQISNAMILVSSE